MLIFKYPIDPVLGDLLTVRMPRGAQVLTVQVQYGTPCLWALVDPEAPHEIRTFATYGTGRPMQVPGNHNGAKYIGTYQVEGGALVFHVFELGVAPCSW